MAHHPRHQRTVDEVLDQNVAWFRSMQKAHPRTDPKKLPGHPGMTEICPVHSIQAREVDTRRRLVCERCLAEGWCDEVVWKRDDIAFVPYDVAGELTVKKVRLLGTDHQGFSYATLEEAVPTWNEKAGGPAGYLRTYSLCRTEEEAWERLKKAQKPGDAMKEENPEFLGKHIPLKEEPAVPELTSEARIDHSHDLEGRGWTDFELMRMHKKLEAAKSALKKIASCRSNIEGDVVDIAQKALKEIE